MTSQAALSPHPSRRTSHRGHNNGYCYSPFLSWIILTAKTTNCKGVDYFSLLNDILDATLQQFLFFHSRIKLNSKRRRKIGDDNFTMMRPPSHQPLSPLLGGSRSLELTTVQLKPCFNKCIHDISHSHNINALSLIRLQV